MRNLKSVLISDYGLSTELTGWLLTGAPAISTDGTAIAGYGRNASGQTEAWLAILAPIQVKVVIQGNGLVVRSPDQTNYTVGQMVTLTAVEDNCLWHFSQWSDGVTNNPRTITVGLSNCFTAVFTSSMPESAALFRPGNLPRGLQGYWKFDGTASDASPNGYHLSNVGTPAYMAGDYWATGEQSGSQSGVNYWGIPDVNCPNLALAGSSFTLSAWIKVDAWNSFYNVIFKKWTPNVGFYFLIVNPGHLSVAIQGANIQTPVAVVSTKKWHHVTFFYDKAAATAGFYVDGNLVHTQAHSIDAVDNAVSFDIGYSAGPPSSPLNGAIKDVAVWDRPLTPIEVKSLALGVDLELLAYRPGNVSVPPTAWWKLNEFSGTRRNAIKGPHPITVAGSAQVDTGQSKFGGGALQLNGTTDYVRTPMADGFNFGSSDFTIEFWIRFTASTGGAQYATVVNRGNGNNYVVCGRTGEAWYFALKDANVIQVNIQEPDALSSGVWYHVACVRNGSSWRVFRDGQLKGSGWTYAPACPNFTSEVDIGATDGVNNVNGWIDEFRISKGIARYTANFTPPAAPFTEDANTSLLLHFDGADGSTNITDSSADYGADLTDINTVGSGAGFTEGTGASFIKANSEYFTAADSTKWIVGTNDASIALWVRFRALGSGNPRPLLGQGQDGSNLRDFHLDYGGGGYNLRFKQSLNGTASINIFQPWNAATGVWYHVGLVKRRSEYRFYVDGLQLGPPQTNASPWLDFAGPMLVGLTAEYNNGFLDGEQADVAFWNGYALTDTEIKALATGLPIQRSGIVSYWPLDEPSGTRSDGVGANHLTSSNGVGSAVGVVGSAASFMRSSSQSLKITDAVQSGLDIDDDITVLYWGKVASPATQYVLSKRAQASTSGYGAFITEANILKFNVNATDWVYTGSLGLSSFFHGAFTFDGAKSRAFFNAALQNEFVTTTKSVDNNLDFVIGAGPDNQYFLDGLLDEAIVARRWFRDEEIKAIYNRGLNGLEAFERVLLPGVPLVYVGGHCLFDGGLMLTNCEPIVLSGGFPGGTIRYTLDGSAPGPSSALYTGPLSLPLPPGTVTLRAVAYSADHSQSATNYGVEIVLPPSQPVKTLVQGQGNIVRTPEVPTYAFCSTVSLMAMPTNCYWAFSHWTDGVITNTANPHIITVGLTNCYTAVFTNLVPNCGGGAVTVLVNGRTNDIFFITNRADVCLTSSIPNAVVRFTTDCLEPTALSMPYSNCFTLFYEGAFPALHTVVVRAAAFDANGTLLGQQACPITIVFTNECEGFYRLFASVKNSGGGLLAGGAVGVFPVHDPYPCGAVLHLNAQPAVGWEFMGWLGDANGTNLTADVTMSEPRCVDAVFGTRLTTGVTGNGAVRRIPDAGQYPYGTAVRLVAEPAAGQFFVGWSGNASGTNAILNFNVIAANPSVTATFAALPVDRYALSMRLNGRGTVTTRPYRNFYSPGVLVTNTAVPDSGQMFLGWSGDTSGMVVVSATSMYVPMSANRAITASYTRGPRLEIASCQGSLSKEGFELMVTGDPGVPYEIQATTMLVAPPSQIQWTPLGTVSNVIGMATFLDRTATNHTQRFYRAVVP